MAPRPIVIPICTARRSLGTENWPSGVSRGIAICVISPSGGVPIASFSSSRPTSSTAMMKRRHVGKAPVEIARERPVNHARQPARNVRAQARQLRRIALHDVQHQPREVLAHERRPPREHLVEDDAQRIDVDAVVGVPARAHLLGRHVLRRADDVAGQRDVAGGRRVGRRSAWRRRSRAPCSRGSMPSASTQRKMLSGLRSRWMTPCACAAATPRIAGSMIATASTNAIGPVRFMRSASVSPDSSSITRQAEPWCSTDVEDGHDVRVIDAPGGERLAAEARQHLVAGGERGQDPLQRDPAIGADVDRRVDLRHAAAAEQPLDPILVRHHLADRQRLRRFGVRGAIPLVHLRLHD